MTPDVRVHAFRIHCLSCRHRGERVVTEGMDTVKEAARLRRLAVCGQCGERRRQFITVEPLWTNPLPPRR